MKWEVDESIRYYNKSLRFHGNSCLYNDLYFCYFKIFIEISTKLKTLSHERGDGAMTHGAEHLQLMQRTLVEFLEPYEGSQLPLTLFPGVLTPSSGLHRHQENR